MKITLRPVRESDDSFLLSLYASTRAAEMAMVPWSDEQKDAFVKMQFAGQKSGYASDYPDAQHSVISADDEPAGRLYLSRSPNSFHILDITIAVSSRNSGIGSAVLQEILKEADRAGKSTTIYVENFNPSQRLFERLGFRVSSVKDFTVLLERQPAPLA
jgi:ribosomal protein S18 acetylase RimI-like enzyme